MFSGLSFQDWLLQKASWQAFSNQWLPELAPGPVCQSRLKKTCISLTLIGATGWLRSTHFPHRKKSYSTLLRPYINYLINCRYVLKEKERNKKKRKKEKKE